MFHAYTYLYGNVLFVFVSLRFSCSLKLKDLGRACIYFQMVTTFSATKQRKENRKIYRACLTSWSRTALLHSEIVSFITSKGEKESGGLPMRLERADEVPTKLERRNFTTKGRRPRREGTSERNRNRLPSDK